MLPPIYVPCRISPLCVCPTTQWNIKVACLSRGGVCTVMAVDALHGTGPGWLLKIEGAVDALAAAGAIPACVKCLQQAAALGGSGPDCAPSLVDAANASVQLLHAFMSRPRFKVALEKEALFAPYVDRLERFRVADTPDASFPPPGQAWQSSRELHVCAYGIELMIRPEGSSLKDLTVASAFMDAGVVGAVLAQLGAMSPPEGRLNVTASPSLISLLSVLIDATPMANVVGVALSQSRAALRVSH